MSSCHAQHALSDRCASPHQPRREDDKATRLTTLPDPRLVLKQSSHEASPSLASKAYHRPHLGRAMQGTSGRAQVFSSLLLAGYAIVKAHCRRASASRQRLSDCTTQPCHKLDRFRCHNHTSKPLWRLRRTIFLSTTVTIRATGCVQGT